MPNTKSAIKSLKQSKKLNAKNSLEKRKAKDLLKKIDKALSAGQTDQVSSLSKEFQKAVDKAVRSGWLKKNTASRKKSRLAKRVKTAVKK